MRPPLLDLLLDEQSLACNGGTLDVRQLHGLFVLAWGENSQLHNGTCEALRWTVVCVFSLEIGPKP